MNKNKEMREECTCEETDFPRETKLANMLRTDHEIMAYSEILSWFIPVHPGKCRIYLGLCY
jgi:hypothetical protein